MYQLSVGNYLREQLQDARETISEMQKEIDKLVFQRDETMNDFQELLPQYEIWRRRAEYWQARYDEEINKNATK